MIRRLISAVAGAAAVLTTLATAPATAAPGAVSLPRACNTQAAAAQLHTTDSVHLRTGRSRHSRSVVVLPKNTDFYAECWGISADEWWAYGKVVSGFATGRRGWVSGDYVATGYRHLAW
ncbi:hypothetical protein NHG22_34835 [Streptomyces sp. ATE26]|uniref:hypothetical protein n=1 Tax=Streptomyces sp. ATE26 TaxID=2954237 RepID=UPI0024829E8B|nr:hypothetical protein [Streptomyces sp. ATE26]MDI1458946.1 hypothetical protein [Streptomyces sp. ATE26]